MAFLQTLFGKVDSLTWGWELIPMRIVSDFRTQLNARVERAVFDSARFPDLDLDREAWNPDRWK